MLTFEDTNGLVIYPAREKPVGNCSPPSDLSGWLRSASRSSANWRVRANCELKYSFDGEIWPSVQARANSQAG